MDLFDHPAYSITKQLMSFCGMWPYQPAIVRNLKQTVMILSATSLIIPEVTFPILLHQPISHLPSRAT